MIQIFKQRAYSRLYNALVPAIFAIAPAMAQVEPGDIAIIRVHGNMDETKDGFTWLALRDIEAGHVLKWTDSGWGTQLEDGVRYSWWLKETTDLSFLPEGSIAAGTTGEVLINRVFPTGGDQLFFYTGQGPLSYTTEEEAGFRWGMQWGMDSGWKSSGSVLSNADSYAPKQLESLGMTVALGQGTHWYYSGSTSGTAEQLLERIRNPNNWSVTDNDRSTWNEVSGESFAINAVPEPAVMALGAGLACLAAASWRRRRA